MDVVSGIAVIIRDILIFVVVMTVLLIALIAIVLKLPDGNPLKRVLKLLSYRLAATVLAGAVAIPVEPIPGLDALYDVAVPIALIWYWFTFFKDARRATPQSYLRRGDRDRDPRAISDR